MREGHLRLILDILDGLCDNAASSMKWKNGVYYCRYCRCLSMELHAADCPIALNALLQEHREEILAEAEQ